MFALYSSFSKSKLCPDFLQLPAVKHQHFILSVDIQCGFLKGDFQFLGLWCVARLGTIYTILKT